MNINLNIADITPVIESVSDLHKDPSIGAKAKVVVDRFFTAITALDPESAPGAPAVIYMLLSNPDARNVIATMIAGSWNIGRKNGLDPSTELTAPGPDSNQYAIVDRPGGGDN